MSMPVNRGARGSSRRLDEAAISAIQLDRPIQKAEAAERAEERVHVAEVELAATKPSREVIAHKIIREVQEIVKHEAGRDRRLIETARQEIDQKLVRIDALSSLLLDRVDEVRNDIVRKTHEQFPPKSRKPLSPLIGGVLACLLFVAAFLGSARFEATLAQRVSDNVVEQIEERLIIRSVLRDVRSGHEAATPVLNPPPWFK